MSKVHDVLIIGGGPAGVIAGIGIAKEGYDVVIIDKKERGNIGKKNCGDALDTKHTNILFEELGIELPNLNNGEVRSEVSKITIASKSLDTKLTASAPAYQVDRLKYGQTLLETAEKNGVKIWDQCTVRGIIIENNYIKGVNYFDQDGERKTILAKITIDASGFIGVMRKDIPKSMSNGVNLSFPKKWTVGSYREIVQFKDGKNHEFQNEIVLLYHKKIKPPGYAWIFTEGKDKLNLGITWVKDIKYPEGKSMKKIYSEILGEYFDPEDYTILDKGGGNIPGMPNFDTLVVNGGMIVGDAGGLADPTTFEGHGPALESGRLASIVAIDALKEENYSSEKLWKYNKLIMNYPGSMHAQSFLVAKFIREMGVDNFSYLLGKNIVTEDFMNKVFREKQKISFIMALSIIGKSFPKWNILLKLLKIYFKVQKIGKIYIEDYPENPLLLNEWRVKRNKVIGENF